MSEAVKPLPIMDDPDTGGHFQAARDGQVAIRACEDCGAVIHLPRSVCSQCGSWRTGWKTVAPRASLYSYSVVGRQVHPAFPAPYTLVLVELEEAAGVRLVGSVEGAPPLRIGQPMRARFHHDGEASFVSWEPDEAAPGA